MCLGRRLICCKTAYDSFLDILKTVGGDNEKHRGAELCKNIEVVDDQMTDVVSKLQLGGKIKSRSKVLELKIKLLKFYHSDCCFYARQYLEVEIFIKLSH